MLMVCINFIEQPAGCKMCKMPLGMEAEMWAIFVYFELKQPLSLKVESFYNISTGELNVKGCTKVLTSFNILRR